MTAAERDELSARELAAMLEALIDAEVEPPPELRAKILARVAQSTIGTPGAVTVRSNDGDWKRCMPGITGKILFDNGTMRTWMARCEAGSAIRAHQHELDEEVFVLEGTLLLNGETLSAGDYQYARAGTRHDQVYTPTGCLVLLRTPSNFAPLAE